MYYRQALMSHQKEQPHFVLINTHIHQDLLEKSLQLSLASWKAKDISLTAPRRPLTLTTIPEIIIL